MSDGGTDSNSKSTRKELLNRLQLSLCCIRWCHWSLQWVLPGSFGCCRSRDHQILGAHSGLRDSFCFYRGSFSCNELALGQI